VTDVWLLEEDWTYEGNNILAVCTSEEKAVRRLKKIKKQRERESGLKIQLTGEYRNPDDDDCLVVDVWHFPDFGRDAEYRARRVPLDRALPM
jgi:hypothetical protein